MSHIYKRAAPKPEPWKPKQWRGYSPTALVREFGDRWLLEAMNNMPDVSASTCCALHETRTFDWHEGFMMTLMEEGIRPRVRDCYDTVES